MQSIEDFEAWVKTKGGQKGLVGAFVRRFPKEKAISQTAVSNWVTRRVIPLERRPQLKILGWDGPWEWPQEVAPAPAAPTVTREEFDRWAGRIERLEADVRALLPMGQALRDLDERVQKLNQRPGSRE